MSWKWAILAACGLSSGCDDDETRRFEEYRAYEHALFETPEECEAAQPPDFFFNCTQTVGFFRDGSVVLVVTDIQNAGTYEITDDRVVLMFDPAHSEVGSRFRFEMIDDSTLIDDAGNEWTLEYSGEEACIEFGIDPVRC
jgi:hypothetical protein